MLFFLLIFGVNNFISIAQVLPEKENDTIIVWTKKRKLTWNDFQLTAHENTRGAQSEVAIDLVSIPTKNNNFRYIVFPYFYKIYSSKTTTDIHVLSHEQLHFDIAELFARKIRQKIKQLNKEKFDFDKYNNEIDFLYERYFLYQENYDAETEHSLKTEKQKEWDEKINIELQELSSFVSEIYN